MENTYIRSFSVRFTDTDTGYKISPVALIQYFQECFALYCTKYNLAAFDIIKDNLLWVISDLKINIQNNFAFWSQNITVKVWISEKTKLKTFLDYEFYNENNELLAKGDSCWYLIDKNTRRPVQSDIITQEMPLNEKTVFGIHDKRSYIVNGDKISENKHNISITDLDFNNHVNNLTYIKFAISSLPADILKENKIDEILVKFLHESFLNNVLFCNVISNKEENILLASIKNETENAEACLVKMHYSEQTSKETNMRDKNIKLNY